MFETKMLLNDKHDLKKFIDFEFELYKDDNNWVAPLTFDTKNTLLGKNNPLFENGEHAFFMAFNDKMPVGRVLVGTDEKLNREKGIKQGYFSMFECINDYSACKLLLDVACGWLKDKGIDNVIGPLSPSNGDDRKGFLVKGEGVAVLLNAYTKDYYPLLIEKYGFVKNDDHYAYLFTKEDFNLERHCKAVEYAKKKGGFRVQRLNAKNILGESKDIKKILDNSVPAEWDYLGVPTLQAVIDEFKSLAQFYNGRYCYIVRKGVKPIAFLVALPDYNQVLKKMKGRIFPFGWFKYLYYKGKISGVRAIVQMVDRGYQNMGVNYAMYYEFNKDLNQTEIEYVEASCIDEVNTASRLSVERLGGTHYRTYRTYRLRLN